MSKTRRKILALVLALVLAVTTFSVMTFADDSENNLGSSDVADLGNSEVSAFALPAGGPTMGNPSLMLRDIVLVLDESWTMQANGSTAEKQPWLNQQAAARKFVADTFELSPNARIAVIYFGSAARALPTTKGNTGGGKFYTAAEKDILIGAIQDADYSAGATNYTAGLTLARSFFDQSVIKEGKAKRMLVFMSDGQPYSDKGSDPTEKYTAADFPQNELNTGGGENRTPRENANRAYNTNEALKTATFEGVGLGPAPIVDEIYTLGFFHNASMASEPVVTSLRALGERLLKDMASVEGNAHIVEDGNKLEFVFEDILNAMVNNSPIIIIPDAMASTLSDSGDNVVWPPAVWNQAALDNLDPTVALQVPAVENIGLDGDITLAEYGVNDLYEPLLTELVSKFGDRRAIYFYSYDFRQSYADNVADFEVFVDDVLTINVRKTADIVGHGAGGYLLGQYLQEKPGNYTKINHALFMGTAFEGAPGAVSQLFMDTDLASYPGAVVSDPVKALSGMSKEVIEKMSGVTTMTPSKAYAEGVEFMEYDASNNLVAIDEVKVEEYLEDIYGSAIFDNIRTAQMTLDFQDILSLQRTYIGYGMMKRTIGGFVFDKDAVTDETIIVDLLFDPFGDGTVPYPSSILNGNLEDIHAISSRAKSFTYYTHNDLVVRPLGINHIVDLLGKNNIPYNDDPTGGPYQVITISCPVDINIVVDGKVVMSSVAGGAQSFEHTVDGETYFGEMYLLNENGSDKIKVLAIDEGLEYTIEIAGYDDGTMDYSVRNVDAANLSELGVRITSIPVSARTKGIASVNPDAEGAIMKLDLDGNGHYDYQYDDTGAGKAIKEPEEPSTPDPEPSKPDPEPSKPDPEPSKPDPEPSKPDPEPSKPDPEPSKPDPEPSKPDPEPSKPEPQGPLFSYGPAEKSGIGSAGKGDISPNLVNAKTSAGGKFTVAAAEALFKASIAEQSGKSAIALRARNYSTADAAAIAKVNELAKKAGVSCIIYFDTVASNRVVYRVKIDPAVVNTAVNVSVLNNNMALEKLFNKYYANDIKVAGFGQTGFTGNVEVAVYVGSMKAADLKFYEYNVATNSYKPVLNPSFRVDNSGYVHYTTNLNSIVIVSEGTLTK